MGDGALYVATDARGVEHTADGPLQWSLPRDGASRVTAGERTLVLRQPAALLDYLDECVWHAEAEDHVTPAEDGTLAARAARLTGAAFWDIEQAVRFAIDCAEHVLGDAGSVTLPHGATLASVLEDARTVLTDPGGGKHEQLGLIAELAALHRLRRDRIDLGDLERAVIVDDAGRDRDVLDDADYETVAPVVDSVLAAIEALRHHVLPHLYRRVDDRLEEVEEDHAMEGRDAAVTRQAHLVMTPFGGSWTGRYVLPYEPAWTSARAAARHARQAMRDRSGEAAERAERTSQAERLEALLEGAASGSASPPGSS